MDTIQEESSAADINARKKAKEIEVELETQRFSANDRIVRKYFQISCTFVANLMMTCYGLICPASGFLIPQLEDHVIGFGINKEEGSWLASIMILGSVTGSLCGGWQCGKFGRKKSLLFDCFFFIVGILMSALAPNFYVLLVARVLLGHSSCSSMVSTPLYTSEISQPMVRKITGSFTMICYTTGYALAVILGASLPWRYALGVIIVVPAAAFIMLFFCPETPVWLLSKGKNEEAKKVLKRLRGIENTDIIQIEYDRISANICANQLGKNEQNESSRSTTTCLSSIKRFFCLLVDPTFIKPLSFLLVIFCFGFEWTGFPAIGFYMVPLLMETQIPIDPYWAAALLSSYRAMLCIFGSTLTGSGRFRRRSIYITCCIIVSLGTFIMATYCYFNQDQQLTINIPVLRWSPIISILCCQGGFALGLGIIPYMYQGEVLPSHARSLGSGFLGVMDNISLFISTKMVPTLFEILGIYGTFWMYSGIAIVVAILSYLYMPETGGMSLEEIEEMYRPAAVENKKSSTRMRTISINSIY